MNLDFLILETIVDNRNVDRWQDQPLHSFKGFRSKTHPVQDTK